MEMKVKLLKSRVGHPVGDIVEFSEAKALRLIAVSEAEKVTFEEQPRPFTKPKKSHRLYKKWSK